MKHVILAITLLGNLLAATTQTVVAQGTIYTSRTLFEQQLSSSTTITMEGLIPSTVGEFVNGFGKTSITVAGVSFVVAPSPTLFVSNPDRVYPIPGDGQYIFNFDSGSPVSILLPGGVTAFGTDFSGGLLNMSFNGTVTVNLAGGSSYDYNVFGTQGSWMFFGATFAEPIASVIFDDGGSGFPTLHGEMLDNVTFGNVIPEPSALGFFALSGALFGWRFLCKRR